MVGVDSGSLYRRTHSLMSSGLVLGRRPLGVVLHSSDEPGELLQWLCHNDSTINIVLGLLLLLLLLLSTDRLGEEVDWRDNGQREEPDASRHRQCQLRCSVGGRRESVTDCNVAVGTEYSESEDRREPVEARRRVEKLADCLAEYPLLHTTCVNN